MLRDGEVAVALTDQEVLSASLVGIRREQESRAAGRKNRFEYGSEAFNWGKHVVGAQAEIAFAKAAGLYWSPSVNTFRTVGDVGIYEVRFSGSWTGRDGVERPATLRCRLDERDDLILVLVTGKSPNFVVHGWRRARDCKRREWLQEPQAGGKAYFVPIRELGPLYTLPNEASIE